MGPNGPFTFIMDGVQYLGGPVGCGCMCLGQHCGLAFHFHGVHSSLCNAQYLLRNVTYDLTDPEQSRITQFGVSGGNPVLPSFHSFDDSLLGAFARCFHKQMTRALDRWRLFSHRAHLR